MPDWEIIEIYISNRTHYTNRHFFLFFFPQFIWWKCKQLRLDLCNPGAGRYSLCFQMHNVPVMSGVQNNSQHRLNTAACIATANTGLMPATYTDANTQLTVTTVLSFFPPFIIIYYSLFYQYYKSRMWRCASLCSGTAGSMLYHLQACGIRGWFW